MLAAVVAALALTGTLSDTSSGRSQLPRGGVSILPENRVVAFYGAPKARGLGTLGIGAPVEAARRLDRRAREYDRPGRPALPALELISTLVLSAPGKQRNYAKHLGTDQIAAYLAAARRIKALLVLDIQPGHADFLPEVKRLEPWLRMPDVGVALDPEWNVAKDEVPGQVFGHVDAGTVNRVSAYLSAIVAANDLPDKLFVVHQFTPQMIRDKPALAPSPGVDTVLDTDGFGTPADKRDVYRRLAPGPGRPFFRGFKLFKVEDAELMKPKAVLSIRKPAPPDFVIYE